MFDVWKKVKSYLILVHVYPDITDMVIKRRK